ncbi:class I SAM-dependent methyltransferase [Nocardia sp. BMG111209]|uniref:class I SAM-dependent methyltransferase n=1 Tax=Nocardia sp. BMG111209 TaxID=1160137 RepID=UPI000377A048|nr:class I SAM-dependent methyltransferase [Nocardia sp. BMG111209]
MFTPTHSPRPDHGAPGPDTLYATKPPWDIDRPQPVFLALAESGALTGRVLDAGCGTGEHALLAAGLGLPATGVDLSAAALATAQAKARTRGLTATFAQCDAGSLADLGESFDTVLDCGLFHLFTGAARDRYVQALATVIPSGGTFFMLGFSDAQPGSFGPHRLSREEIVAAFADGWRLDTLAPATIDVVGPGSVAAWFARVTRR